MDDGHAESSTNETPPMEYSFFLEMKPLSKLKSALESLDDRQFSESRVGRLDADDKGFEILVRNSLNAFAHLRMKSCESITFLSFKPVIGKYVVLSEILDRFPADLNGPHDIVRVYHVVGSDRLSFEFVTTPPSGFSIKFVTVDAPIGRWSPVKVDCATLIPTKTLIEMIEYKSSMAPLEDPRTRKFTAYINVRFVMFHVLRREEKWVFKYKRIKSKGTMGLIDGETFEMDFNWMYTSFLKKASSLSELMAWSFLEDPKDHVMFSFSIGKQSHLAIVKETLSVVNPDTNYSFYLEMKPLHKLRRAIEALADADFNGNGSGTTFCINQDGFGFLVVNTSLDFSRMWLHSSSLVEFHCYRPLVAGICPLGSIYRRFPTHLRGYRDTVCIFNIQGTNRLCFKIGSTPATDEFSVEFNIINFDVRRWLGKTEVIFGTCLPTKDMKQMIDSMLQADDPSTEKVLVTKVGNYATFSTGEEMYWDYVYSKNGLGGTIVVQPGEVNQAWFNWSYTALLKKASFLDFEVAVHFLSLPEDHVMFRFSFGEVGVLSIVKKAISRGP